MKETWGLTGGIAAGKSTAARIFAELGIPVFDADQIARELSREGGQAHPLILQRFGHADRAKLRELVFNDTEARRDLEAILHPLIQAESLARLPADGPAIYEAALLVETGRYRQFQGLIVVEAPRELRKQRLVLRGSPAGPISPALADQIIDAQIPDPVRRQAATIVFDNSSTHESLRAQIQAFVRDRGWLLA